MNSPIVGGMLLFPEFELLDAAGPLAVLGKVPAHLTVTTFADKPGAIPSAQGTEMVAEYGIDDCPPLDLLVVPGGPGTRKEVDNKRLLADIARLAAEAATVFSICTGAALLARAGVLDGRRATTNKLAFDWVRTQSDAVDWISSARWVEDDRFVTSSGVAAGIDAAFAVLRRLLGDEFGARLAAAIEYEPHDDPARDPFAIGSP